MEREARKAPGREAKWKRTTAQEVEDILAAADSGKTQKSIAARFGKHHSTISRIVNGNRRDGSCTQPPDDREWRPVPGFKGYLASDRGELFNEESGFILASGNGRNHTRLNLLTRRRSILVALAWLGPRPQGGHIHHKNENPGDDRPDNLEYLSPREHMRLHRRRMLSDEDVATIRSELKIPYWGQVNALAVHFGVSPNTISRIKGGYTYV